MSKFDKSGGLVLPDEFLEYLKSVKGKRPKTVIAHILKYGHISTEELRSVYGYNHPPRAARDVRELGIPLETFSVKASDGRKIGAYKFGDVSKTEYGKLGGRKALPLKFKKQLAEIYGARCEICLTHYELHHLQVDHCVPYEVGGESKQSTQPEHFMLLCASCNRVKSWSCEHCENWRNQKQPEVCEKCYWGNPENYTHIAQSEIRRLDLTWTGSEIDDFDQLAKLAKERQKDIPNFVKETLRNLLSKHTV